MAAAGLWRVPLLGRALAREGHIPVFRGDRRAADALDAAEAAPGSFRSGLARLAERTGAPVVPVGQASARRVTSGSTVKQLAGLVTAPLRRPELHVHVGAPLTLTGDRAARTARARTAVTTAWRTAAAHLGEPAALAA